MKRRPRQQDTYMREEWKDEYRALSGEIHGLIVNGQPVPEDKKHTLRVLGRYLRSQSGE